MHKYITVHYITLHCITWHYMTWHDMLLHFITYIHMGKYGRTYRGECWDTVPVLYQQRQGKTLWYKTYIQIWCKLWPEWNLDDSRAYVSAIQPWPWRRKECVRNVLFEGYPTCTIFSHQNSWYIVVAGCSSPKTPSDYWWGPTQNLVWPRSPPWSRSTSEKNRKKEAFGKSIFWTIKISRMYQLKRTSSYEFPTFSNRSGDWWHLSNADIICPQPRHHGTAGIIVGTGPFHFLNQVTWAIRYQGH